MTMCPNEAANPRKLKLSLVGWPILGPSCFRWDKDQLVYILPGKDVDCEDAVTPTHDEWQAFWQTCDEINVWAWPPMVGDTQFCDNLHWSLELEHGRHAVVAQGQVYGSHAGFPNQLLRLLQILKAMTNWSKNLARRKNEIKIELETRAQEFAKSHYVAGQFLRLEEVRKSAVQTTQSKQKSEHSSQHAQSGVLYEKQKLARLNLELMQQQRAGARRQLFLRNELPIRQDLEKQATRVNRAIQHLSFAQQQLAFIQTELMDVSIKLTKAETDLATENKDESEKIISKWQKLHDRLCEEARDISRQSREPTSIWLERLAIGRIRTQWVAFHIKNRATSIPGKIKTEIISHTVTTRRSDPI